MSDDPDGIPAPVEVIATRTFELAFHGSQVPVVCKVYRPEPTRDGSTYYCWVEVGWPEKSEIYRAAGVDPIQALWLGLQMLGILVNTSEAAKDNRLTWLSEASGFGLPLPSSIWDVYREDDREMFIGEYRIPRPPRYHRLNLRASALKHRLHHQRQLNRCWCGGIVGNSQRSRSLVSRPSPKQ